MKSNFFISLIMILLIASSCSCEQNQDRNTSADLPTATIDNDGKTSPVNNQKNAAAQLKPQKSTPAQKTTIKVTFIELGSTKCIPCRMMQPIIEEIKKEYPGQVKVIFYDVWTPEGKPYANKFKIIGIPTQIFLDKNGKEYFRHSGFFPKEEILKILRQQGVK